MKMQLFRMALWTPVLIFMNDLFAQLPVPSPAPPQQERIILYGATIHTGTGEVIPNGAIAFEKGRISFIGDATRIKIDASSGRVIDVMGKHIYPGLIAPNTVLGLSEIDAARPTRDFREVGDYNPNVRALIAFNTDSRIIPTVRSNGVLLAQTTPVGGRISGTSAVVQLDAWNWEDALIVEDGIHINWPAQYKRKGWWAEPGGIEPNEDYEKQVQELTGYFKEAKAYALTDNPEKFNIKFEALKPLFQKSKKAYIHAGEVKEILGAIAFIQSFDLDGVIVGADEAYRIADQVAQAGIPLVLNGPHALPDRQDDDIDIPFKRASILKEAGVMFCIGFEGGWGSAWTQRNLPFIAGMLTGYGMTPEEALATVTVNPAKIMGIDASYGSLKPGKSATLLVSEGDLLDMRTSKVVMAFIDGREIDLTDKHKLLYQKFSRKYGIEAP